MKLKVNDIPDEGIEVQATAKDKWLATLVTEAFQKDFAPGHEVTLNLRIMKTCDNVSVIGSAEVNLSPTCDRCAETFKRSLEIPLQIDIAPYPKSDDPSYEERKADKKKDSLAEEDLNFAFYKGSEVNLADLIREMMVLEIPVRYLCKESCKGLCPKCGKNLNTTKCSCQSSPKDSRWAPLEGLKKKLKQH